jgi:hypothetical protein
MLHSLVEENARQKDHDPEQKCFCCGSHLYILFALDVIISPTGPTFKGETNALKVEKPAHGVSTADPTAARLTALTALTTLRILFFISPCFFSLKIRNKRKSVSHVNTVSPVHVYFQ